MSKIWTTRDGTEIPIKDMTDNHLENAIAFLERRAEEVEPQLIADGYSALSSVQGEMAEMLIEGEIRRMEEYGVEVGQIFPIYTDLLDEQARRIR